MKRIECNHLFFLFPFFSSPLDDAPSCGDVVKSSHTRWKVLQCTLCARDKRDVEKSRMGSFDRGPFLSALLTKVRPR